MLTSARRVPALARGVASLAALSLLASTLVLPAAAAQACPAVTGRGNWESIRVPAFSQGGAGIADYAVAGRLILVTNGTAIVRSTDGGCTWDETFRAEAVLPGAEIVIRQIAHVEGSTKPILLLAEERVGAITRPRVFRSGDGGASFATSEAGLLPAGTPETLRMVTGVAYLGVSHGEGVLDQIYASEDGGRTWALQSDPTEVAKQQRITSFEVNPMVPTELWATGPAGGYRSTDGGQTFTAIDDLAGQATGPVDVALTQITFFRPGTQDMLVSTNAGENWLSLGAPEDVTSADHGTDPMEIVVGTGAGDVYLYLPSANAWVNLGAAPGAGDVVVTSTADASYHASTRTTIERYVGSPPVPPPADSGGRRTVIVPSIPDLPKIEEEPARLTGPMDELVLDPGTQRTLSYALRLPRGQRPLDLFFLVDTTDSMKKFIDGLKLSLADIVAGLADAGISARIGLGEYRAYPDHFPPRPDEPNFIYKKRAELSESTAALRDALQSLEYDGGGQYDAQLGALYQTATGAGQDVDPPGPAGQDVPPGQQPNFRLDSEEGDNALRLVLNVSNEPFGRPNPNRGGINDVVDRGGLTSPDIPTFAEVIEKMNAQGLRQIGLELGAAPGTYRDLKRISEGTDALAPEQGVDCDGDGTVDIAAGDPLVCRLGRDVEAAAHIAPTIVNLVKSLPLRESPSLSAAAGGEVVSAITPDTYDGVPLQSGQTLPFRVTYRCSREQAGERFPVTLEARGSDGVLAALQTSVRCAELSDESDDPLPVAPTLFAPALLLPVLPPVAPPTAPIPITELSTATSSQAQTQAQAQAQAAAAAQRQHQPQLAFARSQAAKLELAKEEEYEMSAYNRRQPEMPPSLAFVAAAAAMSFLFGLAMRRQTSLRPARVRRR